MQTLSAESCSLIGNGDQRVNEPTGYVQAMEGAAVTLTCHYDSSPGSKYIFWYKHKNGYGWDSRTDKFSDRFTSSTNTSALQTQLYIKQLKLDDSGIFFCAVPTLVDPPVCLYKNTSRITFIGRNRGWWGPALLK
ncbi:T cell receptor delta variable 1 [Stigmatopora nigra]